LFTNVSGTSRTGARTSPANRGERPNGIETPITGIRKAIAYAKKKLSAAKVVFLMKFSSP
jgi:hypothetical protein